MRLCLDVYFNCWSLVVLILFGYLRRAMGTPRRRMDASGGPLRNRAFLEGIHPEHEIIKHSNALWERAIQILLNSFEHGIDVFIEHPLTAYSWRTQAAKATLALSGVSLFRVYMCEFANEMATEVMRTPRPTDIMTNSLWVSSLAKRCSKSHSHDPHLTGRRAANAATYSLPFAQALAHARRSWARSAW